MIVEHKFFNGAELRSHRTGQPCHYHELIVTGLGIKCRHCGKCIDCEHGLHKWAQTDDGGMYCLNGCGAYVRIESVCK